MSAQPPAARPSLTERRKAQTQLEIARCAAALFAERSAASITVEDVAHASGVALRTFYRYFRTKEDAVAPLLSGGVRDWLTHLESCPGELSVPQALERAARLALTPADEDATEALEWTRGLIRAMRDNPALRSVWHRVHHESEEALLPVLTERVGAEADPLEIRLAAGAANTAMRIAVETWADEDAPAGAAADLAGRCMRELTAGLSLGA